VIAVIDYGMGNLHSVTKAVERLGYEPMVTAAPNRIMEAEAAILPGVGAFGDAMDQLRATGLRETILWYAESGRPLLGICLGMQLLFSSSEEHGAHEGLGLLPGRVVRLSGGVKVPHMGWNRLLKQRDDAIFADWREEHAYYAYFVHSYHVLADRAEDVLAVTDYGRPVTAVVGRGRVYGMQFHPEKSGSDGMKLLANFLRLSRAEAPVRPSAAE
jgi:imidazole glycerol phosphate synthase, glutamine amidotransferase subunit